MFGSSLPLGVVGAQSNEVSKIKEKNKKNSWTQGSWTFSIKN
jgi:hypothetical protein